MTYDTLPLATDLKDLAFASLSSSESPLELVVNNVTISTHYNHEYSYAIFSMSETGVARLGVSLCSRAPLTSISISPLRLNIVGKITAASHTAWCTLPGPGYFIIKVSGTHELLVLIDRPAKLPIPLSTQLEINPILFGARQDECDLPATTAAFRRCLSLVDKNAHRTTIYVPPGRYLVGNLVLPSHTTLYLAAGAVLVFSGQRGDYIRHWWKTSQGRPVTWWISTAFNSKAISICGHGVLDGTLGGQAMSANLVVPIATYNFSISGITLLNSPSWALTAILSNSVCIYEVKLLNRFHDAGENDGVDVMHCDGVYVRHCIGIGLDDPFSTKTWSRAEGDIAYSWPVEAKDPLPPSSNVLFQDLVSWTFCFGVKVGAGVLTAHENVRFERVVIYDCSIGIGIHHSHGTAVAQNIVFEDIDIENVRCENMNKSTWLALMCESSDFDGDGKRVGPCIERVTVDNVVVRDRGHSQAYIFGWDAKRPVVDVDFWNIIMPDGEKATCIEDLGVVDMEGCENYRERIRVEERSGSNIDRSRS